MGTSTKNGVPAKKAVGVKDTVTLSGREPEADGEVNIYDCDVDPSAFSPRLEGKANVRRTSKRRVIFINGMGGNPKKHRGQACAVSAVAGTKVWGVYNASGGFVRGLAQSLRDKITSKLDMKVSKAMSS